MEFLKPTTETGQQLHALLTNLSGSPIQSPNDLKRIFFMYGSKISNEDSFISALYGQKVLKQEPSVFMEKHSSKVFGVQQGIGLCLRTRKSSLKELIVALEWSGNEKVLTEIFNLVEQEAVKKTDGKNSCPPTENNSAVLETIYRIKRETAEEAGKDDVIILAQVQRSPPRAAAEAPPVTSDDGNNGDDTLASDAPLRPYQCRFKECQSYWGTREKRKKHYKMRHDGHCAQCGETDARIMSLRWCKKCCRWPNIIGGPFYCSGHCEKRFDTKLQERGHLAEAIWICNKCDGHFSWFERVQHRC